MVLRWRFDLNIVPPTLCDNYKRLYHFALSNAAIWYYGI